MSAFRLTVRADIVRCLGDKERSMASRVAIVWHNMGLQAVLVYRFGRLLQESRGRLLAWPLLAIGWPLYALFALVIRAAYGIRLELSADIGPGFWVGHFGGVEVADCRFGEHCSIGHQTRIGRAGQPQGPVMGDRVWIGAHVRIEGALRVGDDATIASGAHVIRNVPGRSLVVGDPGRAVFRYDNTQIMPRPHP
jgi:serine O-acetyltransferase